MDSPQSTTKRGFDVNSIQNQNDGTSSTKKEGEDGAHVEAKRFKQELHPLQMGSVLEKIFGFLDTESIKAARQVNPLWSAEGAKMLINKCWVKIPSDLQINDLSSQSKEMNKFKAFLSYKASDHSMIPNITINGVDDFELWKSFGILGPQVKSLKLMEIADEVTWRQILDLLPNLKYLDLNDMECYGFQEGRGFIFKVLTSFLSKAEKDGNPLVIPWLMLEPENVSQLEDIEKLADCKNFVIEILLFQPDIYSLRDVPNLKARAVSILNKLLLSSQSILKRLFLEDCQLYFSTLQFPCMAALNTLSLSYTFKVQIPIVVEHYKFPPSFRFSETVPNLQDIRITYTERYPLAIIGGAPIDFYENLLENTGIAASINSVEVAGGFSDVAVKTLFQTFPNVQDLKMHAFWSSQETFLSLWSLGKNLRKLYLMFDLSVDDAPDLDVIFTGFTPETVGIIKKATNLDPYTMEQLEKLMINPSILNLKELEHLTIEVRGSTVGLPKRILAVATKHAFTIMPSNPQIVIKVVDSAPGLKRARKALEEVSKLGNITFEFHKCSDDAESSDDSDNESASESD